MHPEDGRVISNFIVQALQGHDLTVYGDGSQTRSFCYVDDLIDGLMALMQSPDECIGPMNLGNPGEYTILEVAEMVLKLTGARSQIIFKPLPQDDPTQRQPDITLAKRTLGWEPKVTLEEGLQRTVAYFTTLLHTVQ
jgi:UDP-glucuronate decarboxylase